jgi:hypothetical protein
VVEGVYETVAHVAGLAIVQGESSADGFDVHEFLGFIHEAVPFPEFFAL